MLQLLDDQERIRMERLSKPADRDRFSTAHCLLRVLASGYLREPADHVLIVRSCTQCGEPHGKPRVQARHGPDLEVSLSHTAGRVVVAVGDASTGVDIERVRPLKNLNRIAAATLSAMEHRQLDRVPAAEQAEALLAHWTRKEAVLKALGCGLVVPPETLIVSGPGEPPRVLAWPEGVAKAQMRLRMLSSPLGAGYVGAVAVSSPGDITLWERDGSEIMEQI
ncbi:4'-phosphopantetheinyl transferase superfamily protein [Streptomyces sp. So13.3]|uniref:4'-phosphopantetheinyl transferase family protein n=1 Tax=Streptomyces sp. So13.3 TaxID=2136173 RepID=UPI00164D2CF2|nr:MULTISPECIES: 4'-phosphopantetheinyl transferase superfamily protein [unclassified Streptomyces]MCZ4101612.1 4'-phosphopantetheinyl transferase superfamily protein [Streptomyces sp. H39-C1]QNA76363.1 4'-phosphopantetheinyl transferase superfamily protein [Streptomyces sp. So13.3]